MDTNNPVVPDPVVSDPALNFSLKDTPPTKQFSIGVILKADKPLSNSKSVSSVTVTIVLYGGYRISLVWVSFLSLFSYPKFGFL